MLVQVALDDPEVAGVRPEEKVRNGTDPRDQAKQPVNADGPGMESPDPANPSWPEAASQPMMPPITTQIRIFINASLLSFGADQPNGYSGDPILRRVTASLVPAFELAERGP